MNLCAHTRISYTTIYTIIQYILYIVRVYTFYDVIYFIYQICMYYNGAPSEILRLHIPILNRYYRLINTYMV